MRQQRPGPDDPAFDEPLDGSDPRFVGSVPGPPGERRRELVSSQGPGPVPANPRALVLRLAVPLVALGAALVVGAVFFRALAPSSAVQVVGPEQEVREALAERPHRVCREGRLPCAWLTVVDGRLLALNTSGPIREELGRLGVSWCPSSGYFGSNVSGSRYDPAGTLVSGPSIRSLDRFHVRIDDAGRVLVDFTSLTAGRRAGHGREVIPPHGPDCDEIPFDRDADLVLDRGGGRGATRRRPGRRRARAGARGGARSGAPGGCARRSGPEEGLRVTGQRREDLRPGLGHQEGVLPLGAG